MSQLLVYRLALTSLWLICVLLRTCSSLECKAEINNPPARQLSLCSRKHPTADRISLLPHVNCSCKLVIPAGNAIRIVAVPGARRSGSSQNEAFLVLDKNVDRLPTLYSSGACRERVSSVRHRLYTVSYKTDDVNMNSTLELWLEVLPEASDENATNVFGLECGIQRGSGYKQAVKMFATTQFWSVTTRASPSVRITASDVLLQTTKPSGLTSVSRTEKPSGITRSSPELAVSSSSSPSRGPMADVTVRTSTQSATLSTSTRPSSITEKGNPALAPSSGSSNSYWADTLKNGKFILTMCISLSVAAFIMIVTGAVSYALFRRKNLKHVSGSRRRMLKREKYYSETSYDDEHERSDDGGIFHVTGTHASDVRFQY